MSKLKLYFSARLKKLAKLFRPLKYSIILNFCLFISLGIIFYNNTIVFVILIFLLVFTSLVCKTKWTILAILFILVGGLFSSTRLASIQSDLLINLNKTQKIECGIVEIKSERNYNTQVLVKANSFDMFILTKLVNKTKLHINDSVTLFCKATIPNLKFLDYFESNNTFYNCYTSYYIIQQDKPNLLTTLQAIKNDLITESTKKFTNNLDKELFTAIIFGQRNLTTQFKSLLITSGLYHITTISTFYFIGINTLILSLSRYINKRKLILFTLLGNLLIAIVTLPFNIISIRAIILIFFLNLGLFIGSKVNTLKISLIILVTALIDNPLAWKNLEVAFLITSTLSIHFFKPIIQKAFNINNIFLLLSLASLILILPLSLLLVGSFPLLSVPINFLILPINGLFTLLGLILVASIKLRIGPVTNILLPIIKLYLNNLFQLTRLVSSQTWSVIQPSALIYILIAAIITLLIYLDFKKFIKAHHLLVELS